MNLQKIKELITDIAVDLEMTNVDTGAYIDSAKEKVKEALAEFEKPADEQPSSEELEPFDPAIELCEEIRGYLEAGYECFAVDELVGFAEAYHQRKCAECKNVK